MYHLLFTYVCVPVCHFVSLFVCLSVCETHLLLLHKARLHFNGIKLLDLDTEFECPKKNVQSRNKNNVKNCLNVVYFMILIDVLIDSLQKLNVI